VKSVVILIVLPLLLPKGTIMSQWPSTKARNVLLALEKRGWQVKRQTGSHKVLARVGWEDYIFAFRDSDEIGPKMLARLAKKTDLTSEDL
jgi:predicted RNA binding protein YcfA (HicA-like mRNA interferase family)